MRTCLNNLVSVYKKLGTLLRIDEESFFMKCCVFLKDRHEIGKNKLYPIPKLPVQSKLLNV